MSSLVSSQLMSEQSTLYLSHIDSRSKNIVSGYIRRAQSLLLSDDCEEDEIDRHIPCSVYLFCMQLVDDHFMIQQTTKQWTFRGPLLHRMLNAVNGQAVQTEIFEACKMQWMLTIYPNGPSGSTVGEFKVHLHNLDMPSLWDTVTVRLSFHIQQLSFTGTRIRIFEKETGWSWGGERLSFQEFTNVHPDRLTMTLTLCVLQIKLKQHDDADEPVNAILYHQYQPSLAMDVKTQKDHASGHYSFEWKVDDELMQTMRNNINNLPRRYESEPFHNLWKISIWPNDNNNRCTLGLYMMGLPKLCEKNKDDTVNVRWTLGIKEGDVYQQKTSEFSYRYQMGVFWNTDTLTSTEFQTYTTVTICAEIQILDLLEEKEDKEDQLKKAAMHINDEWKQYMAQNGSMEMGFMNRLVSSPAVEGVDDGKQETKEEAKGEEETEKDAKKQEVRKWLTENVKLPQYYKLFIENGFDELECFQELTYELLDSSSFSDIKTGHRLKILRYVRLQIGTPTLSVVCAHSDDAVDEESD